MTPAKATRPGFRQSLASAYPDSRKSDLPTINLFHPIYHSYTNLVGSRIDIDREWPVRLEDEDAEDLIDTFSEPPQFVERLSPVTVQIGDLVIKGRNWTEAMISVYRHTLDLFEAIGQFIETTMHQGHAGASKVPFISLAIDPNTMHRIVEMDYETGEATYNKLMKQFSDGTASPCLTTPFHSILPLQSETETRLCVRITFLFYEKIIRKYQQFMKRKNEDGLIVLPFWIPECAFNERTIELIREEFAIFCKKERLGRPHLVFLLDSDQAEFTENDVLMKSWNLLEHNGRDADNGAGNGSKPKNKAPAKRGTKRKRDAAGTLHPAVDDASVVFRDRSFSDWVVYANPSVKKLLDRTIAKVDSDLNRQEIHYGWAHFEELESLAHSPKSVLNFQQKLVKLTELGYVPMSPDFYVRGKLRGHLGYADSEPRLVKVRKNSAGDEWAPEAGTFARWQGVKQVLDNGTQALVEPRKYVRNTQNGTVEEEGPQCWKIAWTHVRETCAKAIIGDLDNCKGGMSEVLANMTGLKDPNKRQQNVMEFLLRYTYVYWREHFIQHDLSEADINIHEFANESLRARGKSSLSEQDAAIAGAAAQAIYFVLDSADSCATRHENIDQRGVYQNVMMLTLAHCNACQVYHWLGDTKKARKMVDLLKSELIDFENAYTRHGLAKKGITKKSWESAIASQVVDSNENVVARAASRVAACHLRPIGYTRDFTRDDELKSVNVGHLWSTELANHNFKYENPIYCGVSEA